MKWKPTKRTIIDDTKWHSKFTLLPVHTIDGYIVVCGNVYRRRIANVVYPYEYCAIRGNCPVTKTVYHAPPQATEN